MSNSLNIAICIPTYKRPRYLSGLLESVSEAETKELTLQLIVVDNDSCGSARGTVEQWRPCLPMTIRYCVHPIRGLASVRNRLVMEAIATNADFIAFVDDDQLVTPLWLKALVDVACTTDAGAVVGRWEPLFEPDVPMWVRQSGFWDRDWGATGTEARNFGTGNILLRTEVLSQFPGPFDERTNLSGGEDTLFFQQFRAIGGSAVWAYESLVYERIPATRATIGWMIKRGYRVGVGHGLMVRWNGTKPKGVLIRVVKSLGLMLVNSINLIPAILHGKSQIVPRLAEIARGAGGIVGLVGLSDGFREYKRVHGR